MWTCDDQRQFPSGGDATKSAMICCNLTPLMAWVGNIMRHADLPTDRNRMGWDHAAIALSALCGIHCLATTLLIGATAVVGGVLHSPMIHEAGLAIALLLGGFALGTGLIRHGLLCPALIGAIGLAIMASALTLPHGTLESIVTMIGVAVLAVAHLLNRRALRRCAH